MEGLAIFAIMWSFVATIIWLIIGWRAMIAHENLATQLRRISIPLHEISQTLNKSDRT